MGKFIMKETPKGFVFSLKAGNGEVIAVSQVYKNEKTCRAGIRSVVKNAPAARVEDQTKENFSVQTNPKFEVYKDKSGEFRFRLKAKNGQVIATGEGYKALDGCMNGIASIRKNVPDAIIDFVKDTLPEET